MRLKAQGFVRGAGLVVWLFMFVLLSTGCASSKPDPVRSTGPIPDYYVVVTGDTLYTIAWRYRLDHRLLALANGIAPPYRIYPDQKLRLTEHVVAVHDARRIDKVTTDIDWRWPTRAEIRAEFSRRSSGIDFDLEQLDQVRSSAAGEVVYAGTGLDTYPYLIIVRHDDVYLSAYSLQRKPQVKEGARVKAGGLLADTVSRAEAGGTLHFEIRAKGRTIDPRSLLGPR